MDGKIYNIAFRIQGALSNTFKGSIFSAQQSIGQLGRKMTDLQGVKVKADRFVALKSRIKGLEAEFSNAQAEAARLHQEIRSTDKPSKTLIRNFKQATNRAGRLRQDIRRQREALSNLRRELKGAGYDTMDLVRSSRKLTEEIKRQREAQERLQRMGLKRRQLADQRGRLKGQAMAVGAAAASMLGVVNSYGNVATAEGTLASLGMTEKGIQKISRAAVEYSNMWSGTYAHEFTAASYDIKSAISSLGDDAIAKYTKYSALTAKATKSNVMEMTGLFAKGFGVYRDQFDAFGKSVISGLENLNQEERDIEFGKYFSAGIAYSVQRFKTEGSEMSRFISGLGKIATNAGYSFSSQLATGGILQQTKSGAEADTLFSAFLRSAAQAGDKLNLDFIDEESGMLKSLPEILDTIRENYGGMLNAMDKVELQKAFGTKEAVDMIDLLIDRTQELRDAEKDLDKQLSKGISVTEAMAKATERGPNEAFRLLLQRVGNLSASFGKSMAPAVILVARGIGALAVKIVEIVEKYPAISAVLGGLAAGGITLAAIVVGAGLAFNFAKTGLLAFGLIAGDATAKTVALAVAQKGWALATKLITAAQWALNIAMNANPIGLVVAGVTALIGLGILLYKKWEPFRTLIDSIWNVIKGIVSSIAKVKNLWPFGKGSGNTSLSSAVKNDRLALSPEALKTARGDVAMSVSPTIHVAAGADYGQVKAAVEAGMGESERRFGTMLDGYMSNERRLAYE